MRWQVWLHEDGKAPELAGYVTGKFTAAEDFGQQEIARRLLKTGGVWAGRSMIRQVDIAPIPPSPRVVLAVVLVIVIAVVGTVAWRWFPWAF